MPRKNDWIEIDCVEIEMAGVEAIFIWPKGVARGKELLHCFLVCLSGMSAYRDDKMKTYFCLLVVQVTTF